MCCPATVQEHCWTCFQHCHRVQQQHQDQELAAANLGSSPWCFSAPLWGQSHWQCPQVAPAASREDALHRRFAECGHQRDQNLHADKAARSSKRPPATHRIAWRFFGSERAVSVAPANQLSLQVSAYQVQLMLAIQPSPNQDQVASVVPQAAILQPEPRAAGDLWMQLLRVSSERALPQNFLGHRPSAPSGATAALLRCGTSQSSLAQEVFSPQAW
mmetsp:Transcript_42447/g.79704  ORF Transcript_42447/g.79704 Transcript_42447/m.79704 type:complete len:216 (+) Transcript_42447:307-954(+)